MAPNDQLAIRADRIFAAALDLNPSEQRAWVAQECGDDTELRALVERLLANVAEDDDLITGGGMTGPLWNNLAASLDDERDLDGQLVDRYRLLRELGRGGMAVVYLAERADRQYDQQVALKLIKRGTDTDEVVRRFRQERQIMALTQHPNIARLLDGGSTPEGRPYFVMEYVAGRTIDRYCDDQRLAVRDRLELFLDVARAVAYAHRNLVVHRDIKPSNILVTNEGEAKLLDFGIAKFLDPAARVDLTRTKVRMMTPAFASPEQVKGMPVTTASDVYQLGLLLYLLITGRSPYRADPLSDEIAKAITDEPPTRPSTVVGARPTDSQMDARSTVEMICEQRRTTQARLRRELGGDLDNIILMALRKEPERRYASVLQLIDDIERYLAGRPVVARPNTLTYRMNKFVRRNWIAVAAAATLAIVTTLLVAFYTVQLRGERNRANEAAARASREAAVATEVSDFLVGLFEVSDPGEARGNLVTAREILDRGAERIGSELGDEPLTQARLMKTIGKVYGQLGLYEPAATLLERSVALEAEHRGKDQPEWASSAVELGDLYHQLGRYPEAEGLFQGAQAIYEAPGEEQALATVLDSLAELYMETGRLEESEALFLRAIAILEAEYGPDASKVAEALNNLALLYRTDAKHAQAEPLFRRAIEIMEQRLGADHPYLAAAVNNLALVHWDQEEYEQAEPLFRRSLAVLEKVVGSEHPQVAIALHNLAEMKQEQGDLEIPEALYERSRGILEASLGPDHPNVATSLDSLADLYALRGDYERAEPIFKRALKIRETALGPEHPRVGHILIGYAKLLRATGRAARAEELEVRAQAIRKKYGR
ncbi:MAG: serine/threonine-protein kinase [Acidobacteriota bacterium]